MFQCYYTHRSAGKKTAMKKCSLFSVKYFYWFFVHIYFFNKQSWLRLWRVERVLTGFFGFTLKRWTKTATTSAFLWSIFKSCALSCLFSSSIIPQRERVMKSQEDPDGLRLWIPWSLVRVTRKGNIWSLVAALPRKGNYCLKRAVDQFNIPQVNWNDTGVETLATTLWPTSTARSKETTQIVRTREISSWKRQGNYRSRMLLPLHLVFGNQVQRLQTRERHCGQVWMRTLERIMTGKQGVRFLSLYFAKVYLKISSPVLRCFHQR